MGEKTVRDNGTDQAGEIRPNIARHPALMVLEGMLLGLIIDLDYYPYTIGIEPDTAQERLSIPVKWNGEERLVESEMSLSTFLLLCNRLTGDELSIIGANIGLNKIKQMGLSSA